MANEQHTFPETLTEAFQANVAQLPDAIALRTTGDEMSLTWDEYGRRVQSIAAGLADLEVRAGDRVAIMLVNRPEFHLFDTALLHLGATPFSIYNTFAPEQIRHLLADSAATVVVTEEQFVQRLREAGLDSVQFVVTIEGSADTADPEDRVFLSLDELESNPAPDFDFDSTWRTITPENVATVIYTSGTTGAPKGVEITHASELAMCASTGSLLDVTSADRTISFLPSAHIADRWGCHYLSLVFGTQITTLDNPKNLLPTLIDTQPTIFGATPNVWQKLRAGIEALTSGAPDPAAAPFIREKVGLGAVRIGLAGAAPASPATLGFFRDLGVPAGETWGMSEVSGAALMNVPGANRLGTVGRPIPGIEISLAEDGELLLRGDIVMKGYLNLPEETAHALDSDGWLHTGDLATIDPAGYVTIIDRKKDIIINNAGKNMSPAHIENVLKESTPLAGHAAVIGDRRSFNIALVALDPDAVAAFAVQRGLGHLEFTQIAEHEAVSTAVKEGIERANARLARVEQIKKFSILPHPWEPGGDELTPTAKLRRRPIADKYTAQIDSLYVDTRA